MVDPARTCNRCRLLHRIAKLWKTNEWVQRTSEFSEVNLFDPLTLVPPVTGREEPGLSSTSDVITFDQNWHHLYSTSAGGKDLSSDAHFRLICLMEPEICAKMLKKMSEKRRARFPATTPS